MRVLVLVFFAVWFVACDSVTVDPPSLDTQALQSDPSVLDELRLNLGDSTDEFLKNLLSGLFVCEDPAVPEVPAEKDKSDKSLKLQKTVQDMNYIKCDGSTELTKDADKITEAKTLVIQSIYADVSAFDYFKVYNHHTCDEKYLDKRLESETIKPEDFEGKLIPIWTEGDQAFPQTRIDEDGQIIIAVHVSTTRLPGLVSLVEGLNRLEIVYYSECTEFESEEMKDNKVYSKCKNPQAIGSQFVDVQIEQDVISLPGTFDRKESACEN